MPESKDKLNKTKLPYEKPQILFTEIQVEQALMGICKSGTSVGPMGPSCPGPCSGGS